MLVPRRSAIALLAVVLAGSAGCSDAFSDDDSPETSASSAAPEFSGASDRKGDGVESPDPENCPGGSPRLVEGRPAAWTLVVWSAGDNNLEDVLVEDINEMERGHRGSPNVNVVVQLDRRSEDGSWRYFIQPDDDPDEINSKLVGHSDEELDSGNWKNFAAFGEWATVCYPAEHYMTVIEGHGGGWSPPSDGDDEEDDDRRVRESDDPARLIAPDDTNDTEMSIPGLRRALLEIRGATRHEGDPSWKNRLEIYGSDACLMQTLEVLHGLRGTSKYVLASAENEPGPGWPYYTVLDDLTTRPFYYAQSPRALTRAVVTNYGRSYGSRGGQGDDKDYTLASADMRHVDNAMSDLQNVTEHLTALMDEIRPHLKTARDEVKRYGDSWYSDGVYVDAVTLIEILRERLIEKGLMPAPREHWDGEERWRTLRKAMDAFTGTVENKLIRERTFGRELDRVSGVSIFLPKSEDDWRMSLSKYEESDFATESGWQHIVEATVDAED